MGGKALVPARSQQMVAGGGVFSEDGRGRAWTRPILSNLIITTEKKMLSQFPLHLRLQLKCGNFFIFKKDLRRKEAKNEQKTKFGFASFFCVDFQLN